MNVKVIRLVTGEDVIATVSYREDTLNLKNPLVIMMQPAPNGKGVAINLAPWPFFIEYKPGVTVDVAKASVLTSYDPNDQLKQNYMQQFSPIALPNKTGLILPQ